MASKVLRWGVLAVGLVLAGCGDDATSAPACNDDTRIDCVCSDTGARGHVACDDGVLGACVCEEPDGGGGCTRDIQCDDGAFCNGEELCLPDSPDADERGCVNGMFVPFCEDDIDCTIDRCDDRLNRCVFEPPDADGDGFFDASCTDEDGEPLGDDCDDDDELSFPGNFEVCDDDDRDEDCDPETFGQRDADGDGAIDHLCCNGDNCGDDCDDSLLSRRPLQVEFCDAVDNDCDGEMDEEAVEVPWYADGDGDGFGSGTDFLKSCVPIPGRSLVDTDCADENAARHPGQLEICDFVDNNCNQVADEGTECGNPAGYPVGTTGGAIGAAGGGTSGSGGAGGSGGSGGMDGGVDAGPVDAGTDAGVDAGPPLPDVMECPSRDVTGATEVSGTISTDTTWSGDIHITGDVRISGGTFTIMPGTRIVADPGTVLHVGWNSNLARIDFAGTEAAPITMCGKADLTGYWNGLFIGATTDPASSVRWVLVADAGVTNGGLRIDAPVPMTDVHVRHATDVGIEASDFGPGSDRLVSIDNGGPALALTDDAAVTRLPPNGRWTGNGSDVVEIRDAFWQSDVTVHDPGVPYFIPNDFDFRGDFTYVIDAGVEIQMGADTLIDLGWNSTTSTVLANGTAAAPIVFRGVTQAPSSWAGLIVWPNVRSNSHLRYVEIHDAGFGVPALDMRSPITLDNVTLDGNTAPALVLTQVGLSGASTALTVVNSAGAESPIRIHADALTKLGDSLSISGSSENRVEVLQSTYITSSGTIRDLGVPYYLPFGTRTMGGSAITVEPGVEFVMGNNTLFEIGWNSGAATFAANGTSSNPIVFRHESGQQGGWEGVSLGRGVNTASMFHYVQFLDGGSAATGNLHINMNQPGLPAANLTNCTFSNGSSYGIYQYLDYGVDYSGNGNSFSNNTSGDIRVP